MDKEQQQVIKKAGLEIPTWSVLDKGIKTVARATYYNKEGKELPNLPADPYHLQRYLARGFTLEKPQTSEIKCEVCGKSFKAKIALEGHKHSHKIEKEVN